MRISSLTARCDQVASAADVIAGAKNGNEDLLVQDFAGGRIDNCNGLAAVINEHFVAGFVNLTHADIDSSAESSIQVTEIRIAQAV